MNPSGAGLRQPDARTCGAACMIVAAGASPASFTTDVLAAHRRLTRLRLRGRLQLPWPRALGTPPWAVARELAAVTGTPHRTRVVRWSRSAPPRAGALYVGSRWLPRHVVLVVDAGAGTAEAPPRCYEPASGRVVPLDGRPLAGWRHRWLAVTPVASR
ncbi:hypothetical protein [Nocardioides sp.]|uniref:hypothetical protein n=1 Tax=Nocardioides sp. TaxID=35761 RepID=UPI0027156537|nr:hypothetical protein [Nocardioides sp.]MDO9456722.1 hypothetical protein [Nocardioides sp.]